MRSDFIQNFSWCQNQSKQVFSELRGKLERKITLNGQLTPLVICSIQYSLDPETQGLDFRTEIQIWY